MLHPIYSCLLFMDMRHNKNIVKDYESCSKSSKPHPERRAIAECF